MGSHVFGGEATSVRNANGGVESRTFLWEGGSEGEALTVSESGGGELGPGEGAGGTHTAGPD